MKNEILTEEIIRIQEIMGIPTNLIMEATPNVAFAEKSAKELWATIERIFGKELEQGTEKGLENTIKRLELAVGKENVEELERIIKGSDNFKTKKTNIINHLSNDDIIQKSILEKLKFNNLYKLEIEFFRDKFIRNPEIKKFLDDVYTKCLNKKNGDINEANKLMRRALSSVNFPEESLERYLDTSEISKSGFSGWKIELKNVEPPPKVELSDILGIDPETGLEWEGPSTKKDPNKESIGSIIRKTGKNIQTLKASDDLKWLNKKVASNISILNTVRPAINDCLIRYEQRTLTNVQKIENIFEDIIRTTKKYKGGDLKSLTSDVVSTELRDISQKISRIQGIFQADKTLLYNEIELSLLKNIGEEGKDKIPVIMKEMRRVDPFRATLYEGETRLSRSYFFTFLDNTATQQTLYNVGRIIKSIFTGKWGELLSEIKQLTTRVSTFLATGSPKTWEEIFKYFDDYGLGRGLWKLYQHVWFATHVGLPLAMATWHTLENMFLLATSKWFGDEKGTPEKDFTDNLKNDFLSQYTGYPLGLGNNDDINAATIAIGFLAPGHIFLDDIVNWAGIKLNQLERGELRPENTPKEVFKILTKPVTEKFIQAVNSPTAKEAETAITGIIKDTKNKVNNVVDKSEELLDKGKESVQSYSVYLFFKNYPCYEAKADKSYGDRGVTIEGNILTYKSSETKNFYNAIIKPDGLYWEQNGLKLTCP